jgi:hypothetical protein
MEAEYIEEYFYSMQELELLITTMFEQGYEMTECVSPAAVFKKISDK